MLAKYNDMLKKGGVGGESSPSSRHYTKHREEDRITAETFNRATKIEWSYNLPYLHGEKIFQDRIKIPPETDASLVAAVLLVMNEMITLLQAWATEQKNWQGQIVNMIIQAEPLHTGRDSETHFCRRAYYRMYYIMVTTSFAAIWFWVPSYRAVHWVKVF